MGLIQPLRSSMGGVATDSPLTVLLGEVSASELPLIGSKAAALAQLRNEGYQVPDGFVVTAPALRQCLDRAGVLAEITTLEQAVDAGDPIDLRRASAVIAGLVRTAASNPTVRFAIADAYEHLSAKAAGGIAIPVAVRTSVVSAAGEPTFAGVHRSSTNVRGGSMLLHRVIDCWVSAVSPEAIAYRHHLGLAGLTGVAVLVQAMATADRSVVASSVDPCSAECDDVVIEAALGLGSVLSEGSVVPDRYRVRRHGSTVSETSPGHLDHMVTAVWGASNRRTTLRAGGTDLVLRPSEVRAVADVALQIEHRLGRPQLVDLAIDGHGSITVIQSRTLPMRPHARSRRSPGVDQPPVRPILCSGIGASPGHGSGEALVSRAPRFATIVPGQVLVTATADATPIPALARLTALVSDRGGALCNLAVLCRERGIPAVFGTGTATRDLVPGALIEVDGDRGTVC